MADDASPQPTAQAAAADLVDVAACKRGDEAALRRLIERHQAHVGAIMWRFSRDQAVHAELVHDVFVEAYLSLGGYRGDALFAHWLSRVAIRAGYRHWKRQRKAEPVGRDAGETWQRAMAMPSDALEVSEAAELVHALLAMLPPRDRLVLTLHYLEERSVRETAQLLGWSETMVKVQMWRARAKLEKLANRMEGTT
jgi:RNA polymerase sigma-70 factor (ECF subfamily)